MLKPSNHHLCNKRKRNRLNLECNLLQQRTPYQSRHSWLRWDTLYHNLGKRSKRSFNGICNKCSLEIKLHKQLLQLLPRQRQLHSKGKWYKTEWRRILHRHNKV
jgi:hypothetical protein